MTSAGTSSTAVSDPKNWTFANYLFFGLTYLVMLGYLNEETELESWALFLAPVVPALMVGAWWKFLFFMTVLIGGLYLWGANQG